MSWSAPAMRGPRPATARCATVTGTIAGVKTVVLGPRPAELEEMIQRRRKLGIDVFDEVWEGSYHMAPAAHPRHGYVARQLAVLLAPLARHAGLVGTDPFNLGQPNDFRVPDGGYHRGLPTTTWVPTAAVVVEVVSPDDETYDKFAFYGAHFVDELIVADPAARTVTCWAREGAAYREVAESALLGATAQWLRDGIDWP
jgi:Uma2 family endonuclease